jgi:hypothetical protein
MTYEEVEQLPLKYPQSNFEKFKEKADASFKSFVDQNQIIKIVNEGETTIPMFHSLLNTLFHQVYMSSSSFALAGAMVDSRYTRIREYLFHHAEEEQDHWKWIIQNLRDTGYTGPDPREVFPTVPTQAYISFAMYLAHKQPTARLAMAYMLEGLSGELGQHYGHKTAQQLKLTKEQMSFFIVHGELDQGHSHDILDVLKDSPITPYEWAWCEYAAETTAQLYVNMYNHAALSVLQTVNI